MSIDSEHRTLEPAIPASVRIAFEWEVNGLADKIRGRAYRPYGEKLSREQEETLAKGVASRLIEIARASTREDSAHLSMQSIRMLIYAAMRGVVPFSDDTQDPTRTIRERDQRDFVSELCAALVEQLLDQKPMQAGEAPDVLSTHSEQARSGVAQNLSAEQPRGE